MVTGVPPSDANGFQCHHVATTGGDSENDCGDKLAPVSPLAPAIRDPLATPTIPGWVDPAPAPVGSGADAFDSGDYPWWDTAA